MSASTPDRRQPAPPHGLRRWWLAVAVMAVTAIPFLPGLHGEYVWDDQAYLLDNPHFRGFGPEPLQWMFTTFHGGHYMPLTWLSWSVDDAVWGDNLDGYRAGNLLLHAINALLVLLLADRLLAMAMPNAPPGPRWWSAALVAVLFGVHPLRAESVVWATERKDCLSGAFYLLALLAYLRYATRAGGLRWRGFAWVVLLFAGALLAKVMSVSLPFVALAMDVYPLRRLGGRAGWWNARVQRVWIEKLVLLAMAVATAAVAPLAAEHAQALGGIVKYGLVDRIAISLFSLAYYPVKLLWPVDLSPLYEMPKVVNEFAPRYVASAVFVLVVAAALVAVRRRRPAGIAVAFCYAVILGPVMGLVQVGPQIAADRYTYLSCIGFALLIGAGVLALVTRRRSPTWRQGIAFYSVLAVLALGGLTWRQCTFWTSQRALWRRAVAVDPECVICHYNLGTVYDGEKENDRAIDEYDAALRYDADYAKAANNKGVVLARTDRLDEAIASYKDAIRADANYVDPYLNLAAAYKMRNDYAAIIPLYERVLEIARTVPTAQVNVAEVSVGLGTALMHVGRLQEAFQLLAAAVDADPSNTPGRVSLAQTLARAGRREDALRQLQQAMRIAPKDAKVQGTLAQQLAAAGQTADAEIVFRRAVAMDPNDPGLLASFGTFLSRSGQLEEAEQMLRAAIDADATFVEAYNNLASLLARSGRLDDAARAFAAAIQADPNFMPAYANLAALLTGARRYADARNVLVQGVARWPTERALQRQLAWLLAAAPDDALRDPDRAVQLAESAAAGSAPDDAAMLDILSAAYASAGRYEDAAAVIDRAIQQAAAAGKADLAGELSQRRALYAAGRPYRLPPP